MPETGSAFGGGQSPFAGFFRGPHPPWSPFMAGASPLVWGGAGGADKVDDEDEDEVEEFEDVEGIVEEASFR